MREGKQDRLEWEGGSTGSHYLGQFQAEEVMLGLRRGGSFTPLPPVLGLYIFASMVFF